MCLHAATTQVTHRSTASPHLRSFRIIYGEFPNAEIDFAHTVCKPAYKAMGGIDCPHVMQFKKKGGGGVSRESVESFA